MRVVQFIVTVLLAFILIQFLPFWSIAIAAFVGAVIISKNPSSSFSFGFLSIASFWFFSVWIKSDGIDNTIINRTAEIFTLSPFLLIVLISFIGGLVGGFSAASGTYLRLIIFSSKKRRSPYVS